MVLVSVGRVVVGVGGGGGGCRLCLLLLLLLQQSLLLVSGSFVQRQGGWIVL